MYSGVSPDAGIVQLDSQLLFMRLLLHPLRLLLLGELDRDLRRGERVAVCRYNGDDMRRGEKVCAGIIEMI